MGAAQRKCSALIVIEQGRLPPHSAVTFHATRNIPGSELLSMDLFVAVLALRGRRLEIDIHQLGFKVRRLVAIDASYRAVRTEQRELGLGMIEARELFPRFRSMAGLASRGRAIGARLLHALFELSFVRISVATRATQILPVINDRRLRLEIRRFLVAFGARRGNMASRQHEVRFLVLGQSERGGFVSFKVMAAFTPVEVGCRGELARVLVRMTICAAFELHLKQSVFALWDVTLRAVETRMAALQRICARSVFFDRERRRLPPVYRVARGALSCIGSIGKLAAVRIGLVAIHALLESQRFFEVPACVALRAIDAGMFPLQRELGL